MTDYIERDKSDLGEPDSWVMVALRTPLAVTIMPRNGPKPDALLIAGVAYRRFAECELSFFYDWLRAEAGNIVGVRFYFEKECPAVLDVLRELPYVVFPNDLLIELYFSGTREHKPEISDDQEFMGSEVMISASGDYALLFGMGFASAEELESIRGLRAYVDGAQPK